MSYTENFTFGPISGSPTIKYTLVGTDDTIVVANQTTGIKNDGGGFYYLNKTDFADGQRGRIIFHENSTTQTVGQTWDGTIVGNVWASFALDQDKENADAKTSSRSTYAGGAVASVTAAVTVGTNNDKTAYKLASDGLDQISASMPGTAPTTFPQYIMLGVRYWLNKLTLPKSGNGTLTLFNDSNSAAFTQTASDDGTTQTRGKLQ